MYHIYDVMGTISASVEISLFISGHSLRYTIV